MSNIRSLFEASRSLDRRIEKVISFESTQNEQLKREITEYVVTDSISNSFERLLNHLDMGLGGGAHEIGVWVSGFYGSGKSSFTKYLGFALDPEQKIDDRPFLEWLQAQLKSASLKAQLGTLAKRYPATVIMVDLASAQIAGATMVEISTVLHWTVLQWAGYSKDKKVAYLQFMLEKDGKMGAFKKRIPELAKGRTWEQIQNQPLVVNQLASRLAHEFYPEIFSDALAFQKLRVDEAEKENVRVAEMLDLVRRRSGKENIIFILDEVGQYVAARDNLILNLDGLAKNIKNIGGGKVWLIATAQQTLTEDDPNARLNSAKLFKLADRFPIRVDLEASDIREICYNRLLTKRPASEKELNALFDSHGSALTHHTQLTGSRFYKAALNKDDFRKLYPFLPQHFDILLSLLGQLAKTSGGIGLRSAIKVIQDVLVDQSGLRQGQPLLADDPVGTLATTVTFYDTLRLDIQRSFKHVVDGVGRAEKSFQADSMEAKVAKTIAVLQVLEDFPISRENIAALLHPTVDALSQLEAVKTAVTNLLEEPALHLSEVDGKLRFMSEAVAEIEKMKAAITPHSRELSKTLNEKLREIFARQPEARLAGSRAVAAGVKTTVNSQAVSLIGERDPVQYVIELVSPSIYEKRRDERITDSALPSNKTSVCWLAREDSGLDRLLIDIVQCREVFNQNRNKQVDKEVSDYLNGQLQRAQTLSGELESRLRKMLAAGSLVFRSTPVAVGSLDSDINEAVGKHLEDVAQKVFVKYALAPVQVDGALAERFLKTQNLQQIASQNDPLSLVVTSAGQKKINADHPALVAIQDYLTKHGQVEGGKLLDDFYAPEFGWSKDTTRYLLAAMLVAGVIKLRIGGTDITVRGESAMEALRNNNAFKKAGVALRNSTLTPEAKLRAVQRVLEITGEQVMPLEQDISDAVQKHFPELQRSYAPLESQLKSSGLPGVQRAADLQVSLSEILKGDASDATPRLGAEPCPLVDDLLWARDVLNVFNNGIDQTVGQLRRHLAEIAALPAAGAAGDLITKTVDLRSDAEGLLARDGFFTQVPALQTVLKQLQVAVAEGCKAIASEQAALLDHEVRAIESSLSWPRLGAERQETFGWRFDALKIATPNDLNGLRQLISHQFAISTELARIREEIRILTEAHGDNPSPPPIPKADRQPATEVTLTLPKEITSVIDIEALISEFEKLREKLGDFERVIITWK
ncbi:BREX system P-loop protein BrxC [Opitutaceae bacterium TAV4]|nr:BREX system P-loop protein BrxC [Opitutaceae bacterium TAV4]RRK01993.1 BREX system P-loop protein BrxC [Opitutaceae bacterium TAV3]